MITEERKTKKRQIELEVKQIIEDILQQVFDHEEALSITDKGINIKFLNKKFLRIFLASEMSEPVRRPSWIPDAWAPSCSKCKKIFSQIRRKHHCRACGNVFCGCKLIKNFPRIFHLFFRRKIYKKSKKKSIL